MNKISLTPGQISEIIGMAWADEISFDAIRLNFGLSEKDVILLMRSELKPSSFRLWRKRVSGRPAKHQKLSARHDAAIEDTGQPA